MHPVWPKMLWSGGEELWFSVHAAWGCCFHFGSILKLKLRGTERKSPTTKQSPGQQSLKGGTYPPQGYQEYQVLLTLDPFHSLTYHT